MIDSSVWLAYFQGQDVRVRDIIETHECHTSIIAVAEVADHCTRINLDPELLIEFISSHATIHDLSPKMSVLASRIKMEQRKKKKKFGLADGLHLASAQTIGIPFVTLDSDFSGCKGVKLL